MPCSITTWRSRPNLISNRLAPLLPGLDASARHPQLNPGKHDPVCCTAPTVEPAQTEPVAGNSKGRKLLLALTCGPRTTHSFPQCAPLFYTAVILLFFCASFLYLMVCLLAAKPRSFNEGG